MVSTKRSRSAVKHLLARGRRAKRGAAVFVVVLVVTMLTAIGVFAARAASLTQLASGYDHQSTQNHYASEYGMLAAVTELGTPKRDAYFKAMLAGKDTCYANSFNQADGGMYDNACYHFYLADIQKAVNASKTAYPLFEVATDAGVPGSLGPTPLAGDFVVEASEPGPVGRPVKGTDVGRTGGTPNFTYMQVTLTSTGRVMPETNGVACTDPAGKAAATVAGSESARAFVVIGPLPK